MSSSPHPETFTRMREETPTTANGSRTLTVEETALQGQSGDEDVVSSDEGEHVGVLRLRGDMNARRRRVIQWDENVIDNEHMNKKKTKSKSIFQKITIIITNKKFKFVVFIINLMQLENLQKQKVIVLAMTVVAVAETIVIMVNAIIVIVKEKRREILEMLVQMLMNDNPYIKVYTHKNKNQIYTNEFNKLLDRSLHSSSK